MADDKLKQIQKLLDAAEGNLQSARNLLRNALGNADKEPLNIDDKLTNIDSSLIADAIQGIFDGEVMVAEGGKTYPVPANYASKSKLVEGDGLKLNIADDGSFIFKQILPVERKNLVGTLSQAENGYTVSAEGKSYKVLTASVTFYKANVGDQVTVLVPVDHDASWAAMENVIGNAVSDIEITKPQISALDSTRAELPEESEPAAVDVALPEIIPAPETASIEVETVAASVKDDLGELTLTPPVMETPAEPVDLSTSSPYAVTEENVIPEPLASEPTLDPEAPKIEFPSGGSDLTDDQLLENLKNNLKNIPEPVYTSPGAAAVPRNVDNIVASDLGRMTPAPARPAADQPISELEI